MVAISKSVATFNSGLILQSGLIDSKPTTDFPPSLKLAPPLKLRRHADSALGWLARENAEIAQRYFTSDFRLQTSDF